MAHYTPRELLQYMRDLGVEYRLFEHPPLHTVEDALRERGELGGSYVKNLYLRDRAGQMVLITCLSRRDVHLQRLRRKIGLRRLSFASPAQLLADLGVYPGSVSPLALINAEPSALTFYVDCALRDERLTNLHPLTNEMTVQLPLTSWVELCERWGFQVRWIHFDQLQEEEI